MLQWSTKVRFKLSSFQRPRVRIPSFAKTFLIMFQARSDQNLEIMLPVHRMLKRLIRFTRWNWDRMTFLLSAFRNAVSRLLTLFLK